MRNLLLTTLGAAAAVWAYRYLQTEKGKQLLTDASDVLKDLSTKATDFAKQNLSQRTTSNEVQVS
jgi:hypothetical protein